MKFTRDSNNTISLKIRNRIHFCKKKSTCAISNIIENVSLIYLNNYFN